MSRFVLPLLLFASSLTVMAGATIAPSLPGLRDHFIAVPNADLLVRLALTIPGLAIAISAPLAGNVADRFGRKPVLLAGVVLYGLSGASGLVLDSLPAILVGRVLLGFAVGMVMTAASALIADLYAGPERERVIGLQAAFMGLGGVVFLIGGGLLAEQGWRGPFAIYLLPLLALPVMALAITEPAAATPKAGDAVAFPVRTAVLIYGFAFVGMIAFYIIPVQLPFLLRNIDAPSPTLAGIGIATASMSSALTSLFVLKRIRDRLSIQMTLVLSFLAMTAGYGIVSMAATPRQVLGGLALAGFGLGLQMPVLVGWLQSEVPPQARGRAAGYYTMAVFSGQFVSPFVHAPMARMVGYSGSYLAAAGLTLLLSIAMLAVWRQRSGWQSA
ncbi:MAG: MFS transporter [Hyphomicrobiales bacterium]|nr:MFS transporter [Hyphomicrobiales bacterium]